MARSLDLSPLTDPIDKAELAAFTATARRDPRYLHWRLGFPGFSLFFLGLVLLLLSGFFGLLLHTAVTGQVVVDRPAGDWVTLAVAMTIPIGLFAYCSYLFVKIARDPIQSDEVFRLNRFADRNGLRFTPRDDLEEPVAYPFTPFGKPRTVVRDRFQPAIGSAFDFGLAYKPAMGKIDTTESRWYIAIALDRALPHIVLESTKRRNPLSRMLPVMERDQSFSLEGDFDKYFTLYCPSGYERDALYIFTPDLMALCIDEARTFDVEIIDNWMFVHADRAPRLSDPRVMRRIFRIIDLVGAKALSQTDRYRDVTAEGDMTVVAPPGRRLRTTISIVVVIFAIFAGTGVFWGPLINWIIGA
jgi:hypothetical protein